MRAELDRRQRALAFAGVLLLSAAACVFFLQLDADRPKELLELDGIQLDANAAAQLGEGGDGQGSATAYPSDPTDKMLKMHEADDLDGIALDKHAASILHRARIHALAGRKVKGNRGRNAKGDPAQQLLQKGEKELDSSRYSSAVRDLRKARDMFKNEGRDDWKWAQTLVDDLKRAHPELGSTSDAPSGSSSDTAPKVIAVIRGDAQSAQSAVPAAHAQKKAASTGQGLINKAAKELASGQQFRSLYGLARDEEAKRSGTPRWSPPAEAATSAPRLSQARTSALSQLSSQQTAAAPQGGAKQKQSVLKMALDSAVKDAEQRLIHQNKIALLHEEAAIRRSAAQILQSSNQNGKAASSRTSTSTATTMAAAPADPLDAQRQALLSVVQQPGANAQPQTVVQEQLQTTLAPPVTYSQQLPPQTAAVCTCCVVCVCPCCVCVCALACMVRTYFCDFNLVSVFIMIFLH
jgi:hypothetical protein